MRIRLLALLLPIMLAASCTAQPMPPTPSPSPSATLVSSPTQSGPTTPSPTASPTSSPTSSPSATPSATPLPTPSQSPTASPTATPSLSPAAYDAQALDAALDRLLERQRARYSIPGLSAAVVMPDGHSWSAGAGFASLEEQLRARGDTPFVVGSITKTFITALVMQLAAEGRLSLDDPLAEWLPDYRRHNGATLRQLLAHTAGIFNYFEHPQYNERVFGDPRHQWTASEIVETFGAPPYFAAGTGYHYSNTGFVLLGMVIEKVTGNGLDDELRTRLFEPLRLDDTFFEGRQPPPARSAHGYLIGRSGIPRVINDGTDYRPTTSAATVAWAAGAIVSSPADLATWARALYGGQLLDDAYLAQMTDFDAHPYAGLAYGLGTRTRLIHGQRVIGHTGSLRGYASAMWHFPAQNITVVVLSNRGRVDVNPIADALARTALETVGYLP